MKTLLLLVFGASWRSTLIGYLGAAVIEAATAVDAIPVGPSGKIWLHIAAVLVAAFGRAVKDGAVTGGRVAATPEAKQRIEATERTDSLGFVGLPTLFAVLMLAIGLCLALPARGETPSEPKFGGCLAKSPETCFGPRVSLNLLAIAVRDGAVTRNFNPGIGYGVSFGTGRWSEIGVSAQFTVPSIDGKERFQPALDLSFASGYGHIGLACPIGAGSFRDHAVATFGIGSGQL